MIMNDWHRQWPNVPLNLNRNINYCSNIHYDQPGNPITNTKVFLTNCLGGNDAPYYARIGTTLTQILIDRAMFTQYPVWDHKLMLTDPAGNQSAIWSGSPMSHQPYIAPTRCRKLSTVSELPQLPTCLPLAPSCSNHQCKKNGSRQDITWLQKTTSETAGSISKHLRCC